MKTNLFQIHRVAKNLIKVRLIIKKGSWPEKLMLMQEGLEGKDFMAGERSLMGNEGAEESENGVEYSKDEPRRQLDQDEGHYIRMKDVIDKATCLFSAHEFTYLGECDEICTSEKTAFDSDTEKDDEVSTNRVEQKEDSDTEDFDGDASDEELFIDKCEKEYLNEGRWIRSNSQEVHEKSMDLDSGTRDRDSHKILKIFLGKTKLIKINELTLGRRRLVWQHVTQVATQSTSLSDDEVLKTIEIGKTIGYNLEGRTEDVRAILGDNTEVVNSRNKTDKVDCSLIHSVWGNRKFDFVTKISQGSSGGVIAIWDDSLFKKDRIISEEDGFLAIYGEWLKVGLECLMIVVYAPQDIKKGTLWNRFSQLILGFHAIVIVMGDFNEVRK
ncbi:RNA-directed DNA polymerase, eukaryota [Artemisia annua]|uniref:RNA-directed DNA polymerase, eukaryota n=1 Tax=Artemisia annua TaxID=35608 RepID=A0A2U1MAR2_ARTAN|nr:RNA-directed DNA polymerase, eukaryota [Artemisia annua]